jgi:hypothetical protein
MYKGIRRIRKERYKYRYPRMKLGIKKKVKRRDGVEKKKSSNKKYKWLLISSPFMKKDESQWLTRNQCFLQVYLIPLSMPQTIGLLRRQRNDKYIEIWKGCGMNTAWPM